MKISLEVPQFLFALPSVLQVVSAPAFPEELRLANEVRDRYLFPDAPRPYMTDIVRAFRLARGAARYVEVGTRDKGNLAWLSSFLAPDAHMIDVDLDQIESAKSRLTVEIKPTQTLSFIEGDSVADSTVVAVAEALNGSLADIIFLDSSHMYSHFMAEVSRYWALLKPGGILLTHDIFWEGNEAEKGKAQAAAFLDRHMPVYIVAENDPVSRFVLASSESAVWGGVGIIIKGQ